MTKDKVKSYVGKDQQHRREMMQAVNQGLGGIKDARVLNREGEFIDKFRVEPHNSAKLFTNMTHTPKSLLRLLKQLPLWVGP